MITLKKAIEILTLMGTPTFTGSSDDILAARQLSKEALKHIDELRKGFFGHVCPLLLGETKESKGGTKLKREKAIEILTLNISNRHTDMPPDVLDALKVAVADMTYVNNIRRFPHEADNIPIPGETP